MTSIVRYGAGLLLLATLVSCEGGRNAVDLNVPGRETNPDQSLALTIQGQGQVVSSPRGLDCLNSCTQPLAEAATLEAVPARGWQFAGWEGDCQSTGVQQCQLVGSQAQVTARFLPAPKAAPGQRYSGDMHTHSDHSSDGSLIRQGFDDAAPGNMPLKDIIALVEALGSLDFLPFTDHRTYDHHYDPNWRSEGLLLIPGEEANGRPHATVHGAVDMIDQNASLAEALESRVVQESIWMAHSQGAAWVTAHPDRDSTDDDNNPTDRADAIGVDLVEVWNRAENAELEIDYAENRWNAGWRFGVAGASDNHFKELWALGGTPGRPATEVQAPAFNERALLDAMRGARTTIFSREQASVRLRMRADFDDEADFEFQAGDEVFVPAGSSGRLQIEAVNGIGTRILVYAAPGRSAGPIAEFFPTAVGSEVFTLELTTPDAPTWYRAEARSIGLTEPASLLFGIALGPYDFENLSQELVDQLRAITSPIFISEAPVTPVGPATPPPDRGQADAAEYVLGAPGEFAGFPDAVADGGVLHVVAEQHSDRATTVHYRRRDGDGRWQSSLTLNQSSTGRFPAVAARGDLVAVVWQDERAGQIPRQPAVYARLSQDAGRSFGSEIPVATPEGQAMHPDVAIDTDGVVHVVWQQIVPGQPYDIFTASLKPSGVLSAPRNLSRSDKVFNEANLLDARSARFPASVRPAVAAALDGSVWVAWQDNRFDLDPLWTGQASYGEGTNPDDWQIAVRALAEGSPIDYVGAADRADRHVDIAVDTLGTVYLAWDSKPLQAAGANLEVVASHRKPQDEQFSAPVSVSRQPASSATRPRLAARTPFGMQMTWFDSRSADWRWRAMVADFQHGWSEGRLIPSPGVNTWPVLAGEYVLVATTRNAQRLQRDRTQQIYAVALNEAVDKPVSASALVKSALRLAVCPECEEQHDCFDEHPYKEAVLSFGDLR